MPDKIFRRMENDNVSAGCNMKMTLFRNNEFNFPKLSTIKIQYFTFHISFDFTVLSEIFGAIYAKNLFYCDFRNYDTWISYTYTKYIRML